jgi:hypothetical protein
MLVAIIGSRGWLERSAKDRKGVDRIRLKEDNEEREGGFCSCCLLCNHISEIWEDGWNEAERG